MENDLKYLYNSFKDAKEFGSILEIKSLDFNKIIKLLNDLKLNNTLTKFRYQNEINLLTTIANQAKIISKKYDVVVTNPPYMGNNGMNPNLKEHIKSNFPLAKTDLFAVFLEKGLNMVKNHGFNCMVTMQSWMFLSSFEKFRKKLIETTTISNLLHMDNMVMRIAFGTSATVFRKTTLMNYNSTFYHIKLSDIKNDIVAPSFFNDKSKFVTKQSNFDKIPSCPIAYWADENLINCFNNTKLESIASVKQGLATADNNRFLRFWYEVDFNKIGFSSKTCENSSTSGYKWFPYNKGGSFRKWYGNQEYVINFENNGSELENFEKANVSNREFQFNESISWSRISSSKISFRDYPEGFLFDSASCSIFLNTNLSKKYIIGLLNTNISQKILNCIAPTLNYQAGDISLIPIIFNKNLEKSVVNLVNENISISKRDWDDYEISWNFMKHPFLKYGSDLIETNYNMWENYKNKELTLIKNNEIKLNELFSQIYNLQNDEENESQTPINLANLKEDAKSFISYAIGCMFGRYSLDNDGLQFAGGEFNINNYHKFIPDDDNIIPVLDSEYFEDDIVGRFIEFVKICFGEDTLEENLEFIADALAKNKKSSREKIRDYLLKNFFNDHKKTYKKRPIYWQFNSGKENGFNCLVYIHRYEPNLIARIRTDYLHKTQKAIEQSISNCDNRIKNSSSNTEINKATKDKNKLQKQLKETQDYDEVLAHIANQNIKLDLDNGIKDNYTIFQKIEVTYEGKKSKKVNLLKKI